VLALSVQDLEQQSNTMSRSVILYLLKVFKHVSQKNPRLPAKFQAAAVSRKKDRFTIRLICRTNMTDGGD